MATWPGGRGRAGTEGHLLAAVSDDRRSAVVLRQTRTSGGGTGSARMSIHLVLLRTGRLPLVIAEPDVTVRGERWELRTTGLWADLNCERPGHHWSLGLEAFALAVDRPDELLGRGYGIRTPLGWELDVEAEPGDLRRSGPHTPDGPVRWDQPGRLAGDLLLLPEPGPEPAPPPGVPAWVEAQRRRSEAADRGIRDGDTDGLEVPIAGPARRSHVWRPEVDVERRGPVAVDWRGDLPSLAGPPVEVALPLGPDTPTRWVWWIASRGDTLGARLVEL